MKLSTRFGALALTAAFAALTLTGCAGGSGGTSGGSADGGKQIGYVNLADTDVFCMARESALSSAIEGSEWSVSFSDGNNDNQKQIDQVNAFISRGVDTLVIVPADSKAIVPAINAAEAAGVPVICLGIAAVAAGTMAQTILQDAPGQGAACFDAIQKIAAGETVDSEIIVPFQSITADNVADYQKYALFRFAGHAQWGRRTPLR